MKNTSKTFIAALAASALTVSAFGANRTFNGGIDNTWENTGNWNIALTTADNARLSQGKSVTINNDVSSVVGLYLGVADATATTVDTLTIGDGGKLVLTAGTTGFYMSSFSGSKVGSVVNILSGGILQSASAASISNGSVLNSSGSLTLGTTSVSGGSSLKVFGGTANLGTLHVGPASATTTSSVEISAGTVNTGSIYVATASGAIGAITLNGGTVVAGSNGITLANAANTTGRLFVGGNVSYQGAITIGGATGNAQATFSGQNFTINAPTNSFNLGGTGSTTNFVLGESDFGTIYVSNFTAAAGSRIVIDGKNYAGISSDVITLITFRNETAGRDNITFSFVNFDEAIFGELNAVSNIQWVTVADAGEGSLNLVLTAVPEPAAAAALFGLIGLVAVIRRRK